MKRSGILFVVSAPSGAGKSTLCRCVREQSDIRFSVSCTTRPMRPGEQDGVDYWFKTREEFEQLISEKKFLEHALVHGNWYGTLLDTTLATLDRGEDLLLDIDVQGAESIRNCHDPRILQRMVDIFIMPPSHEELERRLRGRGTEPEEQLQRRLSAAEGEMEYWQRYHYLILSGTKEEDWARFQSILEAERCRASRYQ